MKPFKITSKNVSISPRKMFIIANILRKKEIKVSLENLELSYNNNKSIRIIHKILKSTYKQFLDKNKDKENFEKKSVFINSLKIDTGIVRKKIFFRAKGRADTIKNRKSNITVSLVAV